MSADGENQKGGAGQPPKPKPARSSSGGLYTIIGVIVVLVLVELGGAYYFGGQAETKLNDFVTAQNAQLKLYGYGDKAMTVENYEKGFFSSKAMLRSELNTPFASEPIVVDMPVDIQHGPVLFGKGGLGLGVVRMVMETDIVSIMNKFMPAVSPQTSELKIAGGMQITSSYTLGFTGGYSFNCYAPASKVEVEAPSESLAFTLAPGKVSCSGSMSGDFMSMKGKMTMETATVDIPEMGGEAGTLTGAVFSFDFTLNPDDLPSGYYEFAVDEITIPAVDAVLTDLKTRDELPASDGPTVSWLQEVSIGSTKFSAPQDQTVEIAPIEMEQSFNDISKALVLKYFELVQRISAGDRNDAAMEAMFTDEAFAQEMMGLANEALGYGPDYKISKFRVAVPDRGEANMTFALGVPEGTAFDPNNPEALANAIEADLGVRIHRDFLVYIAEVGMRAQQPGMDPAEVSQMAGSTVDEAVGSIPYFKVEEGVIMVDVSVRNQMVTINDMEPVPLNELLAQFGMGPGVSQPGQPDESAVDPEPEPQQ